jgi:hypothetical protein
MRQKLGPMLFAQEFEGEFVDAESSAFSSQMIELAFVNDFERQSLRPFTRLSSAASCVAGQPALAARDDPSHPRRPRLWRHDHVQKFRVWISGQEQTEVVAGSGEDGVDAVVVAPLR